MLAISPTSRADNFRAALPGYKFQFPRDHAAHPDYATEWWYYTGHLQAQNGRKFGYQLTFFRVGLSPKSQKRKSKWATGEVILGHFAITDEDKNRFLFCDRASRAAAGLAGAQTQTPRVWLGNWSVRFAGRKQWIKADGKNRNDSRGVRFSLSLEQIPLKAPVAHGEKGVSQKSAGIGQASHYYSFSKLQTRGVLKIGDESFAVAGQSWFDKEWGSNQLAKNQIGWDWFSLQLRDGRELMLYQMRLQGGKIDSFSSGTIIERDGRARHLKRSDFQISPLATWKSPVTKADYPSKWRVVLPRERIELTIEPTVAAQELLTARSTNISYWEGSVRAVGTQRGKQIGGNGYVELTGYSAPFRGTF